jgi:hypothetical protein
MAVQEQRTSKKTRELSRGFWIRVFQDQYEALGERVAQTATSIPIEIRSCLDQVLFPDVPNFGLCASKPTQSEPTGDRPAGGAETPTTSGADVTAHT